MTAYAARGTLLQIETATPGTFSTIAQVSQIGFNARRDEIDVSNHDTAGYRSFVNGLAGVELNFTAFYDPASNTHNNDAVHGLTAMFEAGSARNGRIVMNELAGDPTITFNAVLPELTWNFNADGAMEFNGRFRITGAPTFP